MAQPTSMTARAGDSGMSLLDRLCNLYESELAVYDEVRDLTRRQLEAVRRGAGIGELRGMLEQKRARLDRIARLEQQHAAVKILWESRRETAGLDQTRLQGLLREAGARIEEILGIEGEIDRALIAGAGLGA